MSRGPSKPRPWTPLRFSHRAGKAEIYGNDRYTVTREEEGDFVHLAIHSRTRAAVGAHDWRHFQRIKNELAGPEREGVELFPAESRLVDTANEYHVFVFPEGFRFPFGFSDRAVADPDAIADVPIADLEETARDYGTTPEELRTRILRKSKQRPLDREENA